MDYASLRNFKDFLQQYNKITETCFNNCVNTLGERSVTIDEQKCIDMCAVKHIRVNHKVMSVYLEVQPIIMNRRIEEMNQSQSAANVTALGTVATDNPMISSEQTNNQMVDVNQQPVNVQS